VWFLGEPSASAIHIDLIMNRRPNPLNGANRSESPQVVDLLSGFESFGVRAPVAHLDRSALNRMRMKRLLITVLSVCVIGSVFAQDKTGKRNLLEELDSKDAWTRHEAARSIGVMLNSGTLTRSAREVQNAVPKLIRNLYAVEDSKESDNLKGTSQVGNLAWALGTIGDQRALPALAWCLRNPKPEVREGAAWALQCQGFPSDTVVPLLVQALKAETSPKAINQIGASISSKVGKDFGFDQARPSGPFEGMERKKAECLRWWNAEGGRIYDGARHGAEPGAAPNAAPPHW
jgi:hypothetical protein